MKQKSKITTPVYLFIINGLTMCFGFIFFVVISLFTLEKASIIQTKQNLRTFAYALENIMQNKANLILSKPENYDELQKEGYRTLDDFLVNTASHDPSFRITIIGPDGFVIADSDSDVTSVENQKNHGRQRQKLTGKSYWMSLLTSDVSFGGVKEKDIFIVLEKKMVVLKICLKLNKINF